MESNKKSMKEKIFLSIFSGIAGSLLMFFSTLIVDSQPVNIMSDGFEEGKSIGFKEGYSIGYENGYIDGITPKDQDKRFTVKLFPFGLINPIFIIIVYASTAFNILFSFHMMDDAGYCFAVNIFAGIINIMFFFSNNSIYSFWLCTLFIFTFAHVTNGIICNINRKKRPLITSFIIAGLFLISNIVYVLLYSDSLTNFFL